MSVREPHVPLDRLTALALVGQAPEGADGFLFETEIKVS